MDVTTITIIIGVIGAILTVLTVTNTRKKDYTREGEKWGRLETQFEQVSHELKLINQQMTGLKDTMDSTTKDLKQDYRDRIDLLSRKLDDHLREEHNIKVPKTGR